MEHDEVQALESDAKAGRILIELLLPYTGEWGESETPVGALRRILGELNARRDNSAAAAMAQSGERYATQTRVG